MANIGEFYKTADWKTEKHVPAIDCPAQAAAGEAAGDEAALAAQQLQVGGVDPARPAQLARFLASARSDGITGRLFHAVGDDWEAIQAEDLQDDDYTVRRMKPST